MRTGNVRLHLRGTLNYPSSICPGPSILNLQGRCYLKVSKNNSIFLSQRVSFIFSNLTHTQRERSRNHHAAQRAAFVDTKRSDICENVAKTLPRTMLTVEEVNSPGSKAGRMHLSVVEAKAFG